MRNGIPDLHSLIFNAPLQFGCAVTAGAPRAERGPGASSYVMELWFCKVQNRRRKCCWLVRKMMWSPKKKIFSKISTVFRPKSSDFQKKKVFSEISAVFPAKIKRSRPPKKKRSSKFYRFIRPKSSCSHATSMGLSLLNVIWMGPLKSMGPGVIVPPLSEALGNGKWWNAYCQ